MSYPSDNKNPAVMTPPIQPAPSYPGPYASQQQSFPNPHSSGAGTPHSMPPYPQPDYPSGTPPMMTPGMVNQQPGTKEMMSLTPGGNRNAKNMPMTPDGQRDWSNGICDCCGDGAFGTWCLSCWCPCIVYGENSSRIEHLAQNGVPHPKGGDACGGDCWLHCCLTSFLGVGWILQIPGRSRIRSRYSIDGGCFTDCCTVFWCNPCSLTQEHREIQLEERSILQANGMAGV